MHCTENRFNSELNDLGLSHCKWVNYMEIAFYDNRKKANKQTASHNYMAPNAGFQHSLLPIVSEQSHISHWKSDELNEEGNIVDTPYVKQR